MSKILLGLFMISTFMLADVRTADVSATIIQSGIKIIDIRTQREWEETGIVKDSKTITFFDERGDYDLKNFLEKLDNYIQKDEEFALICRTGSRTTVISEFLGKQGYNVINLKGGVVSLMKQGFKLTKYTE